MHLFYYINYIIYITYIWIIYIWLYGSQSCLISMTVFLCRDNYVQYHVFPSERTLLNENEDNNVLPRMNSTIWITFKVRGRKSVWDIDEWWSETVLSVHLGWAFETICQRSLRREYLLASIIKMISQFIQWLKKIGIKDYFEFSC